MINTRCPDYEASLLHNAFYRFLTLVERSSPEALAKIEEHIREEVKMHQFYKEEINFHRAAAEFLKAERKT